MKTRYWSTIFWSIRRSNTSHCLHFYDFYIWVVKSIVFVSDFPLFRFVRLALMINQLFITTLPWLLCTMPIQRRLFSKRSSGTIIESLITLDIIIMCFRLLPTVSGHTVIHSIHYEDIRLRIYMLKFKIYSQWTNEPRVSYHAVAYSYWSESFLPDLPLSGTNMSNLQLLLVFCVNILCLKNAARNNIRYFC